jgi:hypothetical protein
MWDRLKHKREGRKHVHERESSEDLWADLVRHGADVVEHHDNRNSATNIVRRLMRKDKITLQLQRELAENDGYLHKTSIARQLLQDLDERRADAKRMLENKNEKSYTQRQSHESRWKRIFLRRPDRYDDRNSNIVNTDSQEITELKKNLHDLEQEMSALETRKVGPVKFTPYHYVCH